MPDDETKPINGEDLIIEPIRDRLLNKNQNFLLVGCGPTGTGKSVTALALGEKIDPNFNIDRVVFSAQEFMSLLNKPELLLPGSCILWDEAGVNMAAREFQSLLNRLLMKVLQTFRHRNICLILTVPSFSFIDAQARRLLHGYYETVEINRKENRCIVKFMYMQSSPRYGDQIYFHYPCIADTTTKYAKVTRLRVKRPSKNLLKLYEIKRRKFTDGLNRDIEKQLNRTETENKSASFDPYEYANKIKDNKNYKDKKMSVPKIRNIFMGISRDKALQIYAALDELKEKNSNTHSTGDVV